MAPVNHRPAGITTFPPPAPDAASIASRIASVFFTVPPSVAPKSLISKLLSGKEGVSFEAFRREHSGEEFGQELPRENIRTAVTMRARNPNKNNNAARREPKHSVGWGNISGFVILSLYQGALSSMFVSKFRYFVNCFVTLERRSNGKKKESCPAPLLGCRIRLKGLEK